ncbi:MAG: adenosine kinase, partial [Bacteroidales bacterium]|nr:adenosine kinase [Bacteroidales bacterium]
MKKVLGMGNALVDILLKLENDQVLEHLSLPKGSMQLVDMHTANNVITAV